MGSLEARTPGGCASSINQPNEAGVLSSLDAAFCLQTPQKAVSGTTSSYRSEQSQTHLQGRRCRVTDVSGLALRHVNASICHWVALYGPLCVIVPSCEND